jgi:hypothetical protein
MVLVWTTLSTEMSDRSVANGSSTSSMGFTLAQFSGAVDFPLQVYSAGLVPDMKDLVD